MGRLLSEEKEMSSRPIKLVGGVGLVVMFRRLGFGVIDMPPVLPPVCLQGRVV